MKFVEAEPNVVFHLIEFGRNFTNWCLIRHLFFDLTPTIWIESKQHVERRFEALENYTLPNNSTLVSQLFIHIFVKSCHHSCTSHWRFWFLNLNADSHNGAHGLNQKRLWLQCNNCECNRRLPITGKTCIWCHPPPHMVSPSPRVERSNGTLPRNAACGGRIESLMMASTVSPQGTPNPMLILPGLGETWGCSIRELALVTSGPLPWNAPKATDGFRTPQRRLTCYKLWSVHI